MQKELLEWPGKGKIAEREKKKLNNKEEQSSSYIHTHTDTHTHNTHTYNLFYGLHMPWVSGLISILSNNGTERTIARAYSNYVEA